MANLFDRHAQIMFVAYLQGMAQAFYDKGTNQPSSNYIDRFAFRPVTAGLPNVERSNSTRVIDWLLSKNISEYAPAETGGTATILAARTPQGKNAILRIPFFQREKHDHVRIAHPAVQQAFPGASLPHKIGAIEILPFTRFVGLHQREFSNELSSFMCDGVPLLHRMYSLAGLRVQEGLKEDISVLPDGTPLSGDPDGLTFLNGPIKLWQAAADQQFIFRVFPYLAPLAWIKGGKPSQDKFFPADYLTGAAPAAPVSLLEGEPRGHQPVALDAPKA